MTPCAKAGNEYTNLLILNRMEVSGLTKAEWCLTVQWTLTTFTFLMAVIKSVMNEFTKFIYQVGTFIPAHFMTRDLLWFNFSCFSIKNGFSMVLKTVLHLYIYTYNPYIHTWSWILIDY